jgi:hypothetical protein
LIIYEPLQIHLIVDWSWRRSIISRGDDHGIDELFSIAGYKKYGRKMPR